MAIWPISIEFREKGREKSLHQCWLRKSMTKLSTAATYSTGAYWRLPVAMWRPTGYLSMRWSGMGALRRTLFLHFNFLSMCCLLFSLLFIFLFFLFIYLFYSRQTTASKRKMNTIWQFAVCTDFSAICMRVWLSTIDFQMAISRFPCEWKRTMGIISGARVFMWARAGMRQCQNIQTHKILWDRLLLLLSLYAKRFVHRIFC